MKCSNKLILAGAAMLSGVAAIHADEARELRQIRSDIPQKTEYYAKAPSNASYQPRLVGFVTYADSWNDLPSGVNTPVGIYTIDVAPGSMPEPFARIGKANSICNGGAVLADDTYWYIWRQTDPTGISDIDISQLYSYNVVTGEFKSHGTCSSEIASNSDSSWDPVSGLVYGQYTIEGIRKLCIVDYESQTLTPVGDCYSYLGLAFDGTGQLYGIDKAGDLYKVDKTNGSGTKVGSTGVSPRYAQSMAFDHKTGELWWASYQDAGKSSSNLYKVDIATGRATLITAFDDQQEIMGLGVMPAIAPDNAPGYVTDLQIIMDKASANGTITFTLPEYTYMGDELESDVAYKVMANDNELFSGTGVKGSKVTKNITLTSGEVTVGVICSNDKGDGPAAVLQQWVGEDYPLAPLKVTLDLEEATGKVSLTWTPVTEGVHGGYINPDKITYKVIRFPDNQEVGTNLKASTFTEILDEPQLPQDYYYEIKALHDWRESESAQSNHVPFGKGFEIPYVNNFDNADSMKLFYVINGNNDESTWKWSQHQTKTAYIFTGTDCATPQDDWLITPGIDMKAGNRYQITYKIMPNMGAAKFKERMEVAFGLGVDPSGYVTAEKAFDFDGARELERTVIVSPEKDGYYHIGFHALSDTKKGLSINIDDLNIDVLANEDAPAAPADMSVKSSQGTAPITIKFTTPTKKVNGETLENITKVDVFRNINQLVKSIEAPGTGKLLTVTDNKGARGMTKYTVVAYNENGVGERAEVSIYLGLDFPGAPRNIILTDEGNGTLKLTWELPKAGANGGYCDPNNLTYNIYGIENGHAVNYKEGIRGTELLINEGDYYAKDQSPKMYAVAAVNSAGEGNVYPSSEVMIGMPYRYPFAESWVNGNARYDGWYRMSNGANGWYPVSNQSADNDNGCMEFMAAADGDLSYLALGKVDMGAASMPKLIFDYYAIPGADMYILPEINLAYTGKYATADMINFANLSGEEGWRTAVMDLKDFYTSYPYLSVRFLGKGTPANPLRIDNIRILDSNETPNLGFTGLESVQQDMLPNRYYDLTGMPVSAPCKGCIYIVRRPDGSASKIIY